MLPGLLLAAGCGGPAPLTLVDDVVIEAADADVVRFVAVGDTGKGNATQRRVAAAIARTCASRGCDFVILLGDLLYPRGMEDPNDPRAEERVLAPYAQVGAPVYAVLGNHDYAHGRDTRRAQWLLDFAREAPGVALPGHAWAARVGPVALIGLDTAAAFQFGPGEQRAWLDRTLDAHDRPGTWVVVAGHHPLRSDGPHGNAGAYEGWPGVPWMSGTGLGRWLGELCGRADLYLAGHDHSRQLLRHCGMDLVVSGAGSSATAIVDRGNAPRFAKATPGFAWLELTPRGGRALFVDADGIVEETHTLSGP